MPASPLVIATRNSGKLREFRALFAPAGFQLYGLADAGIEGDLFETGSSFAENARLKALFFSRQTGSPVIGDDSGLEVSALNGRPGIYSARYAGAGASDADRIRKLLAEIGHAHDRAARFVCALALAHRGRILVETEGECRGIIAPEPRGGNGFGYDPVFYFPQLRRTYAELTETEKNSWSHRARAVSALIPLLRHWQQPER